MNVSLTLVEKFTVLFVTQLGSCFITENLHNCAGGNKILAAQEYLISNCALYLLVPCDSWSILVTF